MMTVQIDQKDLARISKKLDSLGRRDAFFRPMTQATDHLHAQLSKSRPEGKAYPPVGVGNFSRLASPAQKRAYWARVSAGEIDERPGGGYRRTGQLGREWTTDVSPDGRTGKVGNISDHGQYVMGSRQQRFHAATGWPKVEYIARIEARRVVDFFRRHYVRLIRK